MELKAYLSVLLLKGLSFNHTTTEFQNQIKIKFKKDYSLQEIEDELLIIKLEQEQYVGYIKEYPEDFELKSKR
jgi:hypothetical protein